MKKTYIQPLSNIHKLKAERELLTASDYFIINKTEEVESNEVLSRQESSSLWDDEE